MVNQSSKAFATGDISERESKPYARGTSNKPLAAIAGTRRDQGAGAFRHLVVDGDGDLLLVPGSM
jgi:hypothetical protein